MYKTKELRDQTLQELEETYQQSCKNLFDLRNKQRAQKKREKPHEVRHARKDIARLLTIITEKKNKIREG